ncbi:MAG: hypothetical protein WC356_01860 [Candidatus Micrarchaeia archaeon]|jgi:hypothetical protein
MIDAITKYCVRNGFDIEFAILMAKIAFNDVEFWQDTELSKLRDAVLAKKAGV